MPDTPRWVPTDRVRKVIADSGLTVCEFAGRAEMGPERLEVALRGERGLTSLDVALIAETSGHSVLWLLGDDKDLPEPDYCRYGWPMPCTCGCEDE
jgi:hypothetical protein